MGYNVKNGVCCHAEIMALIINILEITLTTCDFEQYETDSSFN